MSYRISYEDGWAETGATRTEYFRTEYEALHRARELVRESPGMLPAHSSAGVVSLNLP